MYGIRMNTLYDGMENSFNPEKGVEDIDAALAGARDILVENITDNLDAINPVLAKLAGVVLDEADKHYAGIRTMHIFSAIPNFDVDAMLYSVGEVVKVFVTSHNSIINNTVELVQVMLEGTLATIRLNGGEYVTDLTEAARIILNSNLIKNELAPILITPEMHDLYIEYIDTNNYKALKMYRKVGFTNYFLWTF